LSFDAVGADFALRIPSATRGLEMQVGVSVREGEGSVRILFFFWRRKKSLVTIIENDVDIVLLKTFLFSFSF